VKIKCLSGAKLLVNGQAVTKEQELHHHDRVLFGSSHLYVFHSPKVSEWLLCKSAVSWRRVILGN